MLSRALEQTLLRALSLAGERKHEFATVEHLLLSLIDDADAATAMEACGVDLAKLRVQVTKYIDSELEKFVTGGPKDPKPSAAFTRVVQRAAIHVQSSGRDEVTGANVLVALFSERESRAIALLQEQELTRLDLVNLLSHGKAKATGRAEQWRQKTATERSGSIRSEQTNDGDPSRASSRRFRNDILALSDDIAARPKRGFDRIATILVSMIEEVAGRQIDRRRPWLQGKRC